MGSKVVWIAKYVDRSEDKPKKDVVALIVEEKGTVSEAFHRFAKATFGDEYNIDVRAVEFKEAGPLFEGGDE